MSIDLTTLSAREVLSAVYIGYYNRAADAAGMQFWEQVIANTSLDLEAIATDFAGQSETQIVHPFFADPTTSTPSTFITSLYQNLFNRDPDEAGLEFWSGQLQNAIDGVEGSFSVGEIIVKIIEGAVDVEGGTQDRTTILNKIEVAQDWTDAAEADGGDFDADAMANAKAIIADVTDDGATVTAAKATTDAFFAPEPVTNAPILLTSGTDVGPAMTGDENNDQFLAYLQQNPAAGGISNSLSSADRLDGGAGYDSLYAEIVNEFVGTGGIVSPDIQARTTSIEEILFEARELFDSPQVGPGFGGLLTGGGSGGQIVDAKHMTDVERIGSTFSDASLKIENLTTLTQNGDIRNTEDLTIVMDHTENTNSSLQEFASDLTVLFDEDYLIAGQTSQGEAQFFLLDQDAELRLKDGDVGTTAEGRLDEIDKNGIRFQIGDGAPVVISFADALLDENNSNEINDHDAFIAALQDGLAAAIAAGTVPAGTTITREDNNNQIILDDDGLPLNRASLQDGSFSDLIPGIKVTSGNGAEVTPLGYVGPTDLQGDFNVFGRFTNEFETTIDPITINVELDKVGRAGEGGDLIIGGKELTQGGDGIEVFKVSVEGDESRPSWLGNLNSTNDTLDTVEIVTGADFAGSGDVADLIINELGGASLNNGGDETDVRVLDGTDFEGDLTVYSNLDEFGGGAHSYDLGVGDDSLSITFGDDGSDDNAVFGGAAGDSLSIDTGAGDDTVRLDSGNDTGGADLEFLEVETGSGDDTVFFDTDNANAGPLVTSTDTTTGDGARISTSGGEDRVYMHDGSTGATPAELDITGIGNADNFQLFEASLQIEFAGVLTDWIDIDYNRSTYRTSREDIRDAMVTAIEGSALAGMVTVTLLADGTLQATSLVSGAAPLVIDIEGPVGSESLIDNTDAGVSVAATDGGEDEPQSGTKDTGWDLLNAQPTLNQVSLSELQSAWDAWYPQSAGLADLTSADGTDFFGNPAGALADVGDILNHMDGTADALDITGALTGPTGNTSDDNVFNLGANDDLIVLSENGVNTTLTDTENGNGNTVEFTGTFGWDTIVNFTSDDDPVAVDGVNDNDILDFTSYLDMAAHVRATSVGDQDDRVDEAVPYTFINDMGATSSATTIDHNQTRLMDFSELWGDLEADTTGSGPNNFDLVTASDVDAWLELNMGGSVEETTDTGGGVGSQFLVLIGKDGDVEIAYDGSVETFDANHADNQFWAFYAEVTAYDADDDDYDFSVNLLGGADLAETDITGLSPDDFGVALYV